MSGTITGSVYQVPGYPNATLDGVTDSGIFGSFSNEGFFSVKNAMTLVYVPGYKANVLGVNASGTAAYGQATQSGMTFSYVDESGSLTVLPTGETAVGVDNAGDILIDVAASGSTAAYSFLLNNGVATPIVIPGEAVIATAISPRGNFAGVIGSEFDPSQYFVETGGNFQTYSYPKDGEFALPFAPTAVNDSGEIGIGGTGSGYAEVVLDGQALAELNDPHGGPRVVAINSAGDAVFSDESPSGYDGVVYIAGDGEAVITVPGVEYGAAVGLNDEGEIVGNGDLYEHGFEPTGFVAQIPCFAKGTLIATLDGDVPVEDLRVSDVVVLADGGTAAVIWIGHRWASTGELVRVRAGALARGVPVSDLLVTADHGLAIAEVLVPSGLLVNGETIIRETAEAVTVYHVELERHAVLLANGAPAESYLDTGNRAQFANCPLRYNPGVPGGEPCRETVFAGTRLAEALRSLLTPVR